MVKVGSSILVDEAKGEVRHDWLTGLLNQQGFEELLREQVTHAASQGASLSLMLLDLDELQREAPQRVIDDFF